MKPFINTVLFIINIISFVGTVLFSIIGVYDQIMGPAGVEKLFKKLHIPLTYNQMLFIGIFCIVLMGATYILRAKLSGKL